MDLTFLSSIAPSILKISEISLKKRSSSESINKAARTGRLFFLVFFKLQYIIDLIHDNGGQEWHTGQR